MLLLSTEPGENKVNYNQPKQCFWDGEYLHFAKPKEQFKANNV